MSNLSIETEELLAVFVRICSHQFRPFAAIRSGCNFLLLRHGEQEVPEKNNKRYAQGQ